MASIGTSGGYGDYHSFTTGTTSQTQTTGTTTTSQNNQTANSAKLDIGNELLTRYKKLSGISPDLLKDASKMELPDTSQIRERLIKLGINPDKKTNVISVLTPEEQAKIAAAKKAALSELDKKVASTGISYADANSKIEELKDKYKNCYIEYDEEQSLPSVGECVYDIAKIVHRKVFDYSRLPEPARTEYKEALAAKQEIENNNTALCKKAGITVQEENPNEMGDTLDLIRNLAEKFKISDKGDILTKQPTEKEKAARAKLGAKTSSTGVTYKEASAKLAELTKKYKDNPSCRSKFESPQPKYISKYVAPYTAFDPHKMPEPDKTAYFEALQSVNEIEKKNSALLAQAGLSKTAQPNTNYYHDPAKAMIYEKGGNY